ncbi:MAG: outer-membrane lipoprotein carrier protein LolA [Methylovirgula sp.]|jgi:outer membrane lipoprotein-sorting protein
MTSKICLMLGLALGLIWGGAAQATDAVPLAPDAMGPKVPAGQLQAAPVPNGKIAGPPSPFTPLDPQVAIQKANTYFNTTTSMIADFVQIGGDGRRAEGKMYIQKPGRLRFEYAAPATLDIIADGTTVAVIDRKVGSVQPYFIWQTPLKFLLKDQIDLTKDTQVVNVTSEPDTVTILIADKQVFGGPTMIKLMFDPATPNFQLKQWQVTDPQGNETLVSLFNQDFTDKPDPGNFQLYQSSSTK